MAPHIGPNAIFASNTSGLSITELSKAMPAQLRKRFCGIHFFNPPRYMHLVELIPTEDTDPAVLDRLETFLTTTLGKGVIRATDTPTFVANRVGVFSMLATITTRCSSAGFDEVDAYGPAIGRVTAHLSHRGVVASTHGSRREYARRYSARVHPWAPFTIAEMVSQLTEGRAGRRPSPASTLKSASTHSSTSPSIHTDLSAGAVADEVAVDPQ